MTEAEQSAITRAVDALEAIAEHMGALTAQALTAQALPAAGKRPRGRPRKEPAQVHIVGGTDTVQVVATDSAASKAIAAMSPEVRADMARVLASRVEADTVKVPSEEQRKAKFDALKSALKGSLALHGEEVTRERLKFPKFSEVPFEAIDATIERLSA